MNQFPEWLEPQIRGRIIADEIVVGAGVVVEENAIISGKGGPAKRVVLGDHCYIGQGTKIFAPEFVLGDYSKLNERSFGHGDQPLRIGRNCWFGGNVVLDSMGGLDIDDNVGVGAGSQIWTHAQFGDVIEGSRFHSNQYMHIGKDAWLVGHCLVSPVKIEPRSMAMLGSVITSDMLENRIYAGVPAKDLTSKLGHQFEPKSVDQKLTKLNEFIAKFEIEHPEFCGALRGVETVPESEDEGVTWFCVLDRTYSKKQTRAEVQFLKQFVPLLKFSPHGEPPMYTLRDGST